MSRYRMPVEWTDHGARWGNDGLLYLAEWRRGFTVHELRALFFECQQVRSLKIERDAAQRDVETLRGKIERLESRIDWYRRQVTHEARLYPLLHRLNNG